MKNPSAVGWAAIGMFTWGLLKATALSDGRHVRCPSCAARGVTSPKHLLHSTVFAPTLEELNYRQTLPMWIGKQPAAAVFGAMHYSRRLPPGQAALRAAEAGLAGALVYQPAFDAGGLLGSALVHGAHNLGADLGFFLTMREQARHHHTAGCPGCLAGAGPARLSA